MWWKKLFYFLFVIFLGFGTTVLAASINFHEQSKQIVQTYLAKKDYQAVECFFAYAMPNNNKKFIIHDFGDKAHLEVYPCLVKHPYFGYVEGHDIVVKYDVVEDSVAFSLFNVPSNFVTKDTGTNKGGVEITLSDNSTIFLNFDNTFKEEGDFNYYINFYSYISQYYSLTVYLNYEDFIDLGYSENITFKSFKVLDGKGTEHYQYTFSKEVGYNSELHQDFKDMTHDYHEFMMVNGMAIHVGAYEEKARLLKVIDDYIANHSDKYNGKPSTGIIFTTDSFILTVSITAAAYLSIAIVVTRLIFFKKKRAY